MAGTDATAKANAATAAARASGKPEDHKKAELLHRDAADAHDEEGNDNAVDHHTKMADAHAKKAGSSDEEDDDGEAKKPPFGAKKPF